MDATDTGSAPLVRADDLHVTFPGRGGRDVHAVRGVSFHLSAGECLAIVGESGSGKSVTARALMGLAGRGAAVRAARLEVCGRDLLPLRGSQWRAMRGRDLGMVLQDALVSLDPLRTVGAEVGEALRNHGTTPRAGVREQVVGLLEEVSVPEPALRARQYPHELSGGLRQRALIASAMAAGPPVLVADEPTTALDVGVQAQILGLLARRKAEGTAILLISHDLAVVASLADRVAVMHEGVLVEEGPTARLLEAPEHPYTRALLAAVPSAHAKGARLSAPGGTGAGVPVGGVPGGDAGCRYARRCARADEACREAEPPLLPLESASGAARCHHVGDLAVQTLPGGAAPGLAPVRALSVVSRDGAGPSPDPGTPAVVLEVDGVHKSFAGPDRRPRAVVRDVSFRLHAGEVLGVLGESGSGKTTVARIVMGLLEPDQGSVRLLGHPWSGRREPERRPLRRRVQLVQQDPLGAFDPRWTVARIVGEGLGVPGRRGARGARERIAGLLERVGLDADVAARHPARLSGGQRQRVAVARALAPEPDLIVCDEPVSALDVSIQAQILDLFADLRADLGVSLLFISHDLGVIHHVSDRVIVMKDGAVVEQGPVVRVFAAPRAEYTRALLAAVPRLSGPGLSGPGLSGPGPSVPPPAPPGEAAVAATKRQAP